MTAPQKTDVGQAFTAGSFAMVASLIGLWFGGFTGFFIGSVIGLVLGAIVSVVSD